jgi:hypothetical protein
MLQHYLYITIQLVIKELWIFHHIPRCRSTVTAIRPGFRRWSVGLDVRAGCIEL